MNSPTIDNDPQLLELFITDMERQSDLWKPTNYWKAQCRRMQKQLGEVGLAGFRTNWQLMRGIDLGPKQAGLLRPPVFKSPSAAWLARRMPLSARYEGYVEELVKNSNSAYTALISVELSLLYQLLKQGQYSSRICERVEDSGVGDPNLYEFGEKKYSSNLLHHIALLSLLFRTGRADDYARVLEIGGGYGALAEILLKYSAEKLKYFVAVDIPPLVYVTTQYLKAVFPGRVVDYRQVRDWRAISATDIHGKILVIPPWTVPALDLEFDLFWNSASFQEMEDEIIDNYLEQVRNTTRHVFINTLTEGHQKGLGGQREPITFERLARQIRSKGYAECTAPAECLEQDVYRAVLPRHSAALFTRNAPGSARDV